jgi:hypothetical protein
LMGMDGYRWVVMGILMGKLMCVDGYRWVCMGFDGWWGQCFEHISFSEGVCLLEFAKSFKFFQIQKILWNSFKFLTIP